MNKAYFLILRKKTSLIYRIPLIYFIGAITCLSMAKAITAEYRCEPPDVTWDAFEWNEGVGCIEECVKLAYLNGPGCCEARYRSSGAFCRFGKAFAKGYSDSKATLCLGN